MHLFDCEITKEHYKILKFCHGKHHVSYKAIENKFCSLRYPYSYYRFHDNFLFLRSHNFLLQNSSTIDGVTHFDDEVYISYIGGNTYSIMRDEKILFWKKLLISKWFDIAVAFITALITSVNAGTIWSFLTELFR